MVRAASMDSSDRCRGSELKKQFDAAVKVIRNLPADTAEARDAPFQPSDEMKLRFYAFFKQATEGPNQTAKPAFYDIVGKYKWQAWTSLGQMSREEAMLGYVNELKKIVEAMSLNQDVCQFYDVLGPFYEFVFPGKQTSKANGKAILPASGDQARNSAVKVSGYTNGDVNEAGSDGEEFSDTYDHISDDSSGTLISGQDVNADEIISARGEAELTPPRFGMPASSSRSSSSRTQPPRAGRDTGAGVAGSASGASGDGYENPARREAVPEVNEQIAVAILRLQQSMEQVQSRLQSLEHQIRSANTARNNNQVTGQRIQETSVWWPFQSLSPSTTLFLLVWPVFTQLMIERIRNHRAGK